MKQIALSERCIGQGAIMVGFAPATLSTGNAGRRVVAATALILDAESPPPAVRRGRGRG